MESYLNNNIKNLKRETISPKNRCNTTAQLDLEYIYKLYDKKNMILQNRLFTLIIKFHSIFKKLITDINSVLITLGNQAICSKSLLFTINKKDEKLSHLNDRLEMINDTKNLLDNNLLIANNNLNMFISEVQKNFKEFKDIKNEKDKSVHIFYSQKRKKRINNNLNSKTIQKRRLDENYIYINSNPNEKFNNKNNIENNINSMTTSRQRGFSAENHANTTKQNYFNYIKPNNIYLNFNRNEDNSNLLSNFCKNQNKYYYPNKNISPKNIYANKSQEIIKDNIPSRHKNVSRSKSNFSSIKNEQRENNEKMIYSGNISRRNNALIQKKINLSNISKKINNNCLTNLNKNFKKINYRDKILFKQNK